MEVNVFVILALIGRLSASPTLPTSACPPGHYLVCLDSVGCLNVACVLCPEGTFNNHTGSYQCEPCREPCNLTAEVESVSCSSENNRVCDCQTAYYSINSTCLLVTEDSCGDGFRRVKPGLEDGSPIECEPCPTGFTSPGNSSECFSTSEPESGGNEMMLIIFIAVIFVIAVLATVLMYCLCKENEKQKEQRLRITRQAARERTARFSNASQDDVRRFALHMQGRKVSRQYDQAMLAKNNLHAIFSPIGLPAGRRRSSAVSGKLKEIATCPDASLSVPGTAAGGGFGKKSSASAPIFPQRVKNDEMENDNKSPRPSIDTTVSSIGRPSWAHIEFSASKPDGAVPPSPEQPLLAGKSESG